jgi:exodeoxyribonuclease VII small subunit
MPTKKSATFNFESALNELNQLVEKLERGGSPLEESLQDFEKGIALTRQCQKALVDAEQKVQILLEKNGETKLSPYSADEKDEA